MLTDETEKEPHKENERCITRVSFCGDLNGYTVFVSVLDKLRRRESPYETV